MSTSVLKDTKPSRCRQGSQIVNCKILLFPFARSQLVPSAVSYPHNVKVSYRPLVGCRRRRRRREDRRGRAPPPSVGLRRSACADLSTQLHALARTRRQLTAQVSILAVEAGCRGELWITHEGKSNESKFHRVVRSSEITCGKEYGEVVREEEMSNGTGGGGSGSAKKGASPTNNTAGGAAGGAATAAATGTGSDSPSAEIKHKLCCVPGCTKKEQGKWYGKMW